MSPPRIFSFSMSILLQSPSLTGERWPKPQDKHQRRRTGDEAAKATPQQGGRNGALHRLHRCDAKPGNGVLEPTCLMIYIYMYMCVVNMHIYYIYASLIVTGSFANWNWPFSHWSRADSKNCLTPGFQCLYGGCLMMMTHRLPMMSRWMMKDLLVRMNLLVQSSSARPWVIKN